MKMFIFFTMFFSIIFVFSCRSFKVDRVIISTDTKPMYMDFWPLAAEAWKKIVGVKPTLAFIAPKDVYIDETIGDVMRFEPIEGISTALQSQVIRLLLPLYFKDEVCLISDIDMIPLCKSFFIDTVSDIPDDCFVVYKSTAINISLYKEYAMCYNASKGSTFGEIFGIYNIEDITECIKNLAQQFNNEWSTDQQALYFYLNAWENYDTRCVKLGYGTERRVDRSSWGYDIQKLKNGFYVDCHLLRPYKKYKRENDTIAYYLGIGPLMKLES